MGINLIAQNRRSSLSLREENLMSVGVFKTDDTFITLDAFDMFNNEYKEPILKIENEGKIIFVGTFSELEKNLKKKYKQPKK